MDYNPLLIFGQRKGRSWYCISHITSSSFLSISSCCRYQVFCFINSDFFTSFLTFFFFAVYLVAHTYFSVETRDRQILCALVPIQHHIVFLWVLFFLVIFKTEGCRGKNHVKQQHYYSNKV